MALQIRMERYCPNSPASWNSVGAIIYTVCLCCFSHLLRALPGTQWAVSDSGRDGEVGVLSAPVRWDCSQ